jgi:hypothetical protein
MADTRKKLLEKQLTKAEQAKADRLEAANKYMDTYKVNPDNWLAKLGRHLYSYSCQLLRSGF